MLIYVIPFILLLVIAIVLKKRETNKQAEQTSTVKTKGKKVSPTKKTPQKTQIVADPVIEKKKTTALSADQRSKIESLISERNFFSAEAQINQALNKDGSQHELYLLLLDLHILQKDEFAINQLINHLRSLGLDDFVEQAQVKKAAYQQEIKSTSNTVGVQPQSRTAIPIEPTRTDDFDALMKPSTPSVADNTHAFNQLQQDLEPTKTKTQEIIPLDFNNFSFDQKPVETTKAEPTQPVADIQPVDFSALSLEPQTKVSPEQALSSPQEPAAVEDIQTLDFSFGADTATEQPVIIPAPSVESKQDEKPEFNFNFSDSDALSPTEAKKEGVANDQPILDFNLDPLSAAETSLAPSLETTSEQNLTQNLDLPTTTARQIDLNDPLVQSFPELANSQESDVNLELAEQYIVLGAYESARALLTENEAEYTAEQRLQADQLRKQIAS